MSTILLGHLGSDRMFRYVHKDETQFVMESVLFELTHRDWDVNDPAARDAAARTELGDDYERGPVFDVPVNGGSTPDTTQPGSSPTGDRKV